MCEYQKELNQLNVQVLIISFGTLAAAQNWMAETCSPFRLLLDPQRVVYRAYELERSWRRSWNLKTIWRYVQLLSSGRRWRGIMGDSAQLGGDFVIDKAGIVRLAYQSHDPTDRPPVGQLLSILHGVRRCSDA